MSALECWRKGCDVVVVERASEISSLGMQIELSQTYCTSTNQVLGDFFTIPPSGMSTLKYYPSMHEDYHKDIYSVDVSANSWMARREYVSMRIDLMAG